MNTQYQEFLNRYESIVRGGITGEMERLGEMTKRVMQWLFTYEPSIAMQAMALLDDDKEQEYHNYLSRQEANEIVGKMDPEPQWTPETLDKMMDSAGMTTDEPPYFNHWALLATMSMILSDSGETLKEELGSDIRPAKADEILRLVYKLAIDKLKDKDGRFNIRKYFDL